MISVDPKYSTYERDQIKYEKLNQDPHDNEEEDDDVVFARNGSLSNGIEHSTNHTTEINEIQLEKAKILKRGNDVEVKVKKLRTVTKQRALCICCIFLVIVAFILSWLLVLPIFMSGNQADVIKHYQSPTPDWTLMFKNTSKLDLRTSSYMYMYMSDFYA